MKSEGKRKKKEPKNQDIEKDMLKPITKANSKLDKEMQEWEVESSKGGQEFQ
jgi:hypothetical protein